MPSPMWAPTSGWTSWAMTSKYLALSQSTMRHGNHHVHRADHLVEQDAPHAPHQVCPPPPMPEGKFPSWCLPANFRHVEGYQLKC